MTRSLYTALFLLYSVSYAMTGRAQGRVSNVRMRPLDRQGIEIRYDLRNSNARDSVYVRLQRRNGTLLAPDPASISGALGNKRLDGRDLRIVWNLRRNKLFLQEEVRALVLLKQGTSLTPPPSRPEPVTPPLPPDTGTSVAYKTYRGPAWALLSLLAPGMGNAFVQTPKPRVGLRPLVTVAAYGLLLYGAGQQGEAEQTYKAYASAGNEAAGEPFYQRANAAHQRYYVATRLAAAIWVTDITLTLLHGIRNQQAEKQGGQPLSFHVTYQANTPVAVVRYSF